MAQRCAARAAGAGLHQPLALGRAGQTAARAARWPAARAAWRAAGVAAALAVACVGTARAAASAPVAVPAVLTQPAVVSPKALSAATLAVTRAGARLVAAGERGTVLLSDDEGKTWRQARVPVQVTLTSLRFLNERTGWATGHLGVILRTDDGGQTWVKQLDGVQAAQALAAQAAQLTDEAARRRAEQLAKEGPDKPFFDLDFADERRGLAVGAYNLAFATEDGGQTWQAATQRLPNPKGLHLYAVRHTPQGQWWVAGEQGLLLRSDDSATRFAAMPSPYKGSFFGFLATRSGSLLAHGLRGHVLRSTDQGESWQLVPSGLTVSLSAAAELAPGRLGLLGQNGELLLSQDDGASFQRSPPAAGPVPATGLTATDDRHLVLSSLRGMRRLPLP